MSAPIQTWALGPLEVSCREYLGERQPGISEGDYLDSLTKLVKLRERYVKLN